MKKTIYTAVFVIFWGLCGAWSGFAQSTELKFSGDLGADAVFVPALPFFSTAEFELNLSVALLDAKFASETRFDLEDLVRQAFILQIAVGQLVVENELKFRSELAFDHDKLKAVLVLPNVEIGSILLIEDIAPTQSPSIQLGWVFHFSWIANEHLRLFIDTGFGVTQISEDLDHDLDEEIDFNVQSVFEFSEAVVGGKLLLSPLFFEAKTIFTNLGFSKQIFTSGLDFEEPSFFLSNSLAIDANFLLSQIELNVKHSVGFLAWQSTTVIEGGGPFVLTLQRFQAFVNLFKSITLKALAEFDQAGVAQARLGVRILF